MALLGKCCCCLNLRTGALLIGLNYVAIFSLVIIKEPLNMIHNREGYFDRSANVVKLTAFTFALFSLPGAFLLIASALFHRKKPVLVIPMLVTLVLMVLVNLFLAGFLMVNGVSQLLFSSVVCLLVQSHFCWALYRYYSEIKAEMSEGQGQRRPIELTSIEKH